jgi:hypothetical protein
MRKDDARSMTLATQVRRPPFETKPLIERLLRRARRRDSNRRSDGNAIAR